MKIALLFEGRKKLFRSISKYLWFILKFIPLAQQKWLLLLFDSFLGFRAEFLLTKDFFGVFLLSYVNFEDKVRNLHIKGQAYLFVHCVGNSLNFKMSYDIWKLTKCSSTYNHLSMVSYFFFGFRKLISLPMRRQKLKHFLLTFFDRKELITKRQRRATTIMQKGRRLSAITGNPIDGWYASHFLLRIQLAISLARSRPL